MSIWWRRDFPGGDTFAVCDKCNKEWQYGNEWHMQDLEGHEC